MKKYVLSFIALAALSACQTAAPVKNQTVDYSPEKEARIRLFGQNQQPTIMTYGIDCQAGQRGKKINTGGSLGDAFGSLVGSVNSHSIGIAQTVHTQTLGEKNGILSRAFFREYVVPAHKAVNASTAFVGLSNKLDTPSYTLIQHEGSCQSNTVSFTPQAGRDYEVVGVTGKACGVAVLEVSKTGELTPVKTQEAVQCRK